MIPIETRAEEYPRRHILNKVIASFAVRVTVSGIYYNSKLLIGDFSGNCSGMRPSMKPAEAVGV